MFKEAKKLKLLDPKKREVHALQTSINQPSIAVADNPAAQTFAFIAALWTEDKRGIDTYIMLFQPKSDVVQFFQHEGGAVSDDDYWQVENDALHFTESMGFMMDNINFADLGEAQQEELLWNFPPFMPNRKLYQATQISKVSSNQPNEKTMADGSPEADQKIRDFVELDAEAEVILDQQVDSGFVERSVEAVGEAFGEATAIATPGLELSSDEIAQFERDEFAKSDEPPRIEPAKASPQKAEAPKDNTALTRLLTSF